MKIKNTIPELLAPAGDFDALVAAVSAGADAVYVGGKSFSARAFAKNFDIDELARAASYCHLHSVKLYVTVNTLVYDKELAALSDYAIALYNVGVDAVITADLGAIKLISEVAPKLPIHASTQMSVHNLLGARAAAFLGCTRVVLARELSYSDICEITERSPIETEVFLHGALCVCHSGQCLFSSLVGGRSGNRGECAQPCRLPYGKGYPLSLSDLSLAEHVTELIASGTASLKIEGRMKSPDYVYGVTKIYRRLLDERRNASRAEMEELARIFSRGGFTDGYFTGKHDGMRGVRSREDKEITRELERGTYTPDRVRVTAKARFTEGAPSELTLTLGDHSVTSKGEAPSKAINAPMTEASLKARLCKMGNTLLALDEGDITLELSEGINLAPSAINALRRDCQEKLERLVGTMGREPIKTVTPVKTVKRAYLEEKYNTALFLDGNTAKRVIAKGGVKGFRHVFLPLWQVDESLPRDVVGVYLPPVIIERELEGVREMLGRARDMGYKTALVGNIGEISLVREYGFIPIGDFRLNVTNGYSREVYKDMGVDEIILSPEITLPMARDIGGGEICYGRIPLMLLERCYMKENFGCKSCGKCSLKDRTGAEFPLMRESGHRNLLLNSAVTYMGDKQGELDSFRIGHRHFIFTTEGCDEAMRVISAFKSGAPCPLAVPIRRIGKR